MTKGEAEGRVETSGAAQTDSGRKPRGVGDGASKVTARREPSRPERWQLIEAAVEHENIGSGVVT
jgi:hypothetical protein